MNERYKKIMDMPRHISDKRAPMPKIDRAAQFAPYSALSGYEDAVEETARLTDQKTELDEYEKEKINDTLTSLLDQTEDTKVKITFFRPDEKKSGGAYVTIKGEIALIDTVKRKILLVGGKEINIDDLIELQKIQDFEEF